MRRSKTTGKAQGCYKTLGGTRYLDSAFTVFGEVIQGVAGPLPHVRINKCKAGKVKLNFIADFAIALLGD